MNKPLLIIVTDVISPQSLSTYNRKLASFPPQKLNPRKRRSCSQ